MSKIPKPTRDTTLLMPRDGIHSLWRAWADQQAKPQIELIAYFDDGSGGGFHIFHPWRRAETYTIDNEVYEVDVDTSKFDGQGWLSDGPMSKKDILRLAKLWFEKQNSTVTSLDLREI